MKIKTIEIKNFRLIENESINLDEEISLVVGKNNSGKTSFVDLFFEFLEVDKPQKFGLVDFSCSSFDKFTDAYNAFKSYVQSTKDKEDEKIQEEKRLEIENLLPKIELNILIEYNKGAPPETLGDSLENLSEFITDLDEEKNSAWICIEYSCDDAVKLFELFELEKVNKELELITFIEENLPSKYSTKYYAGNKNHDSYQRQIIENPSGKINSVFLTRTVSAQRYFLNKSINSENTNNPNSLSGGFSKYYESSNKDTEPVDEIKKALADIEKTMGEKYNILFKPILADLKGFGAETPTKIPDIEILSKFNTEGVLKRNIRYFYQRNGVNIPEKNNGLGYNNLIYMILQFASFFEEIKNKTPKSEFLLLFIEEPEVYMHPQMQQLFIRHIKEYIAGNNVQAQIIITTHSSHIVAESGIDEKKGFNRIRYFDISSGELKVKDFSELKINEDDGDELQKMKFLQQYLLTQKCDLFFADYVIMVEGVTERILMPYMIKNISPELKNKYISIIEVGGAYAHKFRELLEFINVPTLIITDIDSININSNRSACKVDTNEYVETSNQTIIKFTEKRKIKDLLELKIDHKVFKNIRIAFQIKEKTELTCGRSFEEAFILKNGSILCKNSNLNASKEFFDEKEKSYLIENSYEETLNLLKKVSKSDFAFDIMLIDGWVTPKYIQEGLEWLKQR